MALSNQGCCHKMIDNYFIHVIILIFIFIVNASSGIIVILFCFSSEDNIHQKYYYTLLSLGPATIFFDLLYVIMVCCYTYRLKRRAKLMREYLSNRSSVNYEGRVDLLGGEF